jgi:hypothetical protein
LEASLSEPELKLEKGSEESEILKGQLPLSCGPCGPTFAVRQGAGEEAVFAILYRWISVQFPTFLITNRCVA